MALVTPAGPGMRNGNRHTALRWAAFLRAAGHAVEVSVQWSPLQSSRHGAADAMLALHARRSYPSIKAFPSDRPLVVALTGTDVYRDIRESAEAPALHAPPRSPRIGVFAGVGRLGGARPGPAVHPDPGGWPEARESLELAH